jgi:hypothetical protein
MSAATPEPDPVPNECVAVWPLVCDDLRSEYANVEGVCADMMARDAFGRAKYGTPLQPFNGRDALTDAYQEALDLAVYLKQVELEGLPAGTVYGHALAIVLALHRGIAERDFLASAEVTP